jgi:hypothetical protein
MAKKPPSSGRLRRWVADAVRRGEEERARQWRESFGGDDLAASIATALEALRQPAAPAKATDKPNASTEPVSHKELVAFFKTRIGVRENRDEAAAAAQEHFKDRPPLKVKQVRTARTALGLKGKAGRPKKSEKIIRKKNPENP